MSDPRDDRPQEENPAAEQQRYEDPIEEAVDEVDPGPDGEGLDEGGIAL